MGRIALERRSGRLAALAMAVGMAIAGQEAWGAQTAVSWGGSNSNWNLAANWSPAVVPQNGTPGGTTYAVTVNTGTVGLDVTAVVDSLLLGGSGTFNEGTGFNLTTGTLTDGGAMTFAGGGHLTVSGATTLTNGLYIGNASTASFGSVTSSGSFYTSYFSGGNNTVTVTGAYTNQAGSLLSVGGTGDVMSVQSLSSAGAVQIGTGATLKITGGTGMSDVPSGARLTISGNFVMSPSGTSAIAGLASVEGELDLYSGALFTLTSSNVTLSSSGRLFIGNGTNVSFAGNVSNSDNMYMSYYESGNNTMTVAGTLTNHNSSGFYILGVGDVVNVGQLANSGTIQIATGATLNITGGGAGMTDVVSGSDIQVNGAFNVINGNVSTSALANLASVEGEVDFYSGGNFVMGASTVTNTGRMFVGDATKATFSGNVINSGTFYTSYYQPVNNTVTIGGTLTNQSNGTFYLLGAGDVGNVGQLVNHGAIQIGTGATLNITGGGAGMTDVLAGSAIEIVGAFNVINGNVSTSALANLASVEGEVDFYSGGNFTIGTSTVTNTGYIYLGDATKVTFSGNVSNNFVLYTSSYQSGNNTLTVAGTLTNQSNGRFYLLGVGDVGNVGHLVNSGAIEIATGATLNITGGGSGVTDVVANSDILLYGTFNVINGNVSTSALANLASVEGEVDFYSGGNLTVSPSTVTNIGSIYLGDATKVTFSGNLSNSGNLKTSYYQSGNNTLTVAGTLTNQAGANFYLLGVGDVGNVTHLVNNGTIQVNAGATLNITGGGSGVTDVVAGSEIYLLGALNVINGNVTTGALANLASVEGELDLNTGGSFNFGSITNSGRLDVGDGTSVTINGNVTNPGTFDTSFYVSGNNTVTVTGTFTNSASGNLNIIGSGDKLTLGALANQGTVTIYGNTTVNLGTITGAGTVYLNAATLTVGSANSTTAFVDNGTGSTLTTTGNLATGAIQLANLVVQGQHTINSSTVASKVSTLMLSGNTSSWSSGINLTPLTKLVVENTSGHAAEVGTLKSMVSYGASHTDGIYSSGLLPGQVVVVSDLAVTDASTPQVTNVNGVGTDAGSILVMPTYLGDANMDGVVNIQDLQAIANHWQANVQDWRQGDFNGDGIVNILDLQTLANHWQYGAGAGGGSGESFSEAMGMLPAFGGTGSAPEPGSLVVMGIGAVMLLKRRRRM